MHQSTPLWDIFEIVCEGPALSNPFADVTLEAVSSYGNREVKVSGFYDGGRIWRVRFMPDTLGDWTFVTRSNLPTLDGQVGKLTCIAARPGVHGPVPTR